jgi:hypothetical protein
MVERGSVVVQSIAKEDAPRIDRGSLVDRDAKKDVTRLGFAFGREGVMASIDEGIDFTVKFGAVLLCPLKLDPGPIQRIHFTGP